VLNIVGDPRGVRKCSCYGDSFLQVSTLHFMSKAAFYCANNDGSMIKFPSYIYFFFRELFLVIALFQEARTTRQLGILQSPTKVLAHLPSFAISACQGNLSVRPLSPNSMLFIMIKSSLPAYNTIGEEGGSLL